MIALVRIALRRPYTFIVLALAILIIGPLAALRTPVDIFPDIRIPVVAIVWQYTGLEPELMAGRITSQSQRALTTTVNDIEHIEATSYNGLGIIKVFFQPGADIRLANAQITAISQTHAQADAAEHDAAADPQLQCLDCSDHPARVFPAQACPSRRWPTSASIRCAHLSSQFPAPASPCPTAASCARCRSTSIRRAMQARGLSGQDVANALAAQNLITPVGHREDRLVRVCHPAQQCAVRDRRPRRPADQDRQRRDGLYPRRRARARRQSAADQHRPCRRQPLGADAGAEERLGLDARHHRRHQAEARRDQGHPAARSSRSRRSAISRSSSRPR